MNNHFSWALPFKIVLWIVIIEKERYLVIPVISLQVLPGPNLKSMSAADEKMINDAIELANQLASTSLSVSQHVIGY